MKTQLLPHCGVAEKRDLPPTSPLWSFQDSIRAHIVSEDRQFLERTTGVIQKTEMRTSSC